VLAKLRGNKLSSASVIAGNPTNAESWTCDKHNIRLRGADSAESEMVTNTCPIDNHLTLLAELGARSQKFLDLFHTENANDQAWHKSLLLALKQQYAEALKLKIMNKD